MPAVEPIFPVSALELRNYRSGGLRSRSGSWRNTEISRYGLPSTLLPMIPIWTYTPTRNQDNNNQPTSWHIQTPGVYIIYTTVQLAAVIPQVPLLRVFILAIIIRLRFNVQRTSEHKAWAIPRSASSFAPAHWETV